MHPVSFYNICFVQFALYKYKWAKQRSLQQRLSDGINWYNWQREGVAFSNGKTKCFSETSQNRGSPTVVLESLLVLRTFTFISIDSHFMLSNPTKLH